MRALATVLIIAVAAVALSIIVQPKSKDLTPDPATRDDQRRTANNAATSSAIPPPDAFSPPMEGVIHGTITITGRGEYAFELYPKAAPKTVAHFVDLVNRKFYDGILVHRVEPGFVVQAGDPGTRKFTSKQLSDMSPEQISQAGIGGGGSGQNVPFEANALNNVSGSMAMALNSPRSATGDSQFFINVNNNHPLDRDYCVFGKITNGVDILPTIKRGDVIQSITIGK